MISCSWLDPIKFNWYDKLWYQCGLISLLGGGQGITIRDNFCLRWNGYWIQSTRTGWFQQFDWIERTGKRSALLLLALIMLIYFRFAVHGQQKYAGWAATQDNVTKLPTSSVEKSTTQNGSILNRYTANLYTPIFHEINDKAIIRSLMI